MITLTIPQREAIRSLCREYQVMKLELFGSATRVDFDPQRSDIDVLVEFVPATDLGPWMARFFDLQRRLEAILNRKVDLVMSNGLRNPYLIRAVNQD
ncbi:MAG: nucleotidyltransferase domain-containing protein, partial [Herpetosiphonaceae bacterium]|nr:nucleotidyltransferase domain-containing protein [Herpetosiphonaceae bacterium]